MGKKRDTRDLLKLLVVAMVSEVHISVQTFQSLGIDYV